MYNYNRIIFKDNETPLNALTMNHLEVAIHKLANNSLFPSDLIAGEGIDISSTCDGKVKIEQKNINDKSLYSLNIDRLDVVYEIPSYATTGQLFLLLDESTKKLKGLYWGHICIFSNDNIEDSNENDGTL
jgi:hypothetical protein